MTKHPKNRWGELRCDSSSTGFFPVVRGHLEGVIVAVFTALVTNALLARLLSPQDLGAYFLALSLASFGVALGSLGLGRGIVRFVAESIGLGQPARARQAIRVVYRIGLPGALVTGLLYLFFGDIVAERVFHSPALCLGNRHSRRLDGVYDTPESSGRNFPWLSRHTLRNRL